MVTTAAPAGWREEGWPNTSSPKLPCCCYTQCDLCKTTHNCNVSIYKTVGWSRQLSLSYDREVDEHSLRGKLRKVERIAFDRLEGVGTCSVRVTYYYRRHILLENVLSSWSVKIVENCDWLDDNWKRFAAFYWDLFVIDNLLDFHVLFCYFYNSYEFIVRPCSK